MSSSNQVNIPLVVPSTPKDSPRSPTPQVYNRVKRLIVHQMTLF